MILRPATPLALAVLAALALLVSWQLAVVGALALGTAVVVDALVARRARRPVERSAPAYAARGTAFPVSIRVEPGLPTRVKQPQTAAIRVDGREANGGLATTAVALERGRQVLPAPRARVWGPLGLAGWGGAAGTDGSVEVYPDLPGARRLARAAREGRLHAAGRRRGPLGLGTEFESVREYRDDDDIRFVNWRATQRLGRPMTNQFRVERDRDVICLLDCGRLVAAPVGSATRLDVFVDAVLAVAAVAEDVGDRAGLIAFDHDLRRVLTPRRRAARDLLAALYDLEPRAVASDYLRAFAEVGGAKRAFVLVLTDIVEPAAAEPLVAALPLLARRHAVAVASVVDPGLEAILTTVTRAPADAYRQVAAVEVDREREAVVGRLRGARAQVIEAPPETLAAACVSGYLEAKARARL